MLEEKLTILNAGEKVHIIERRLFNEDLRMKILDILRYLFTGAPSEIGECEPPPLPYVDSQEHESNPHKDSHTLKRRWLPFSQTVQYLKPAKG
jgi:hypothetical protein